MDPATDTTRLLQEARAGEPEANERLFAHLYDDLHALARLRLHAYKPDATLGTTGLVHESFLRLIDRGRVTPADRKHFMALAAQAMRYVLVDRARARQRQKRGGGQLAVSLDDVALVAEERAADLLALDEALDRLRAENERLAEIVEYRFFGGFTYAEIAELTGRSDTTCERDWARARLWLYETIRGAEHPVPPASE